VDHHHRRAHANTGDLGLEGALEFAVEMRHVRRGTPHVEADHAIKAGAARGARHRDDAAGGAGQNRVLAGEQAGGGESARRHHEHHARAGSLDVERARDAGDVARENRREVRVDDGSVAAADELDQRRDLVADRNLREAHFAGESGDAALVLRVTIGVHEDDRQRVEAAPARRLEIAPHGVEIGRALDHAIGQHALVDLDDVAVELFGLDDVARENLRPRLIADLQRVAEPARRHQQRRLALALEERVGGDGGAHFHRADGAGGDRRAGGQAEQIAHPLDGGVLISGAFGEQLADMQTPGGVAADDVGERAAAVDPEIPAALVAAGRCGLGGG
jgi:hypothetical protein